MLFTDFVQDTARTGARGCFRLATDPDLGSEETRYPARRLYVQSEQFPQRRV